MVKLICVYCGSDTFTLQVIRKKMELDTVCSVCKKAFLYFEVPNNLSQFIKMARLRKELK